MIEELVKISSILCFI